MPSLRMLEYLLAVADERNFRRAAQAAHVSQPTLSQQIRLLEDRLGVTLVDRGSGEAALTPIGREIAERARRIVREVADLKYVARIARNEAGAGILRLGSSPTIGPYLLPRIVAGLHAALPRLRLHIREGIPDDLLTALANGDIDLLLAPLPLSGGGLHVERVMVEPLRLVAPVDHPLAAQRRVSAGQLADHAVLSLGRRHHLHREVAHICAALRMTLLYDYEGTSLDTLHQMCASGLGLTILPELYLQSEVGGRSGVTVLEIEDFTMTRDIALLWRRDAPFESICLSLAERIRAVAAA